MTARVLVLAGTAEARALCHALAGREGLVVTAALAGATSDPASLGVETLRGGFGGADGLAQSVTARRIDLLIDATHPFATRISATAARVAAETGVARLALVRRPWTIRRAWQTVPDEPTAAAALPTGARALLTVGRRHIDAFAARTDCRIWLRSIEPVDAVPPHITPVVQPPPYDTAAETDLFDRIAPTHLVTRNSGGAHPAKLAVAEARGAAVIVIDAPPGPSPPIVETVEDAVAATLAFRESVSGA